MMVLSCSTGMVMEQHEPCRRYAHTPSPVYHVGRWNDAGIEWVTQSSCLQSIVPKPPMAIVSGMVRGGSLRMYMASE